MAGSTKFKTYCSGDEGNLADQQWEVQDEIPNDRKIGKLVEYASKNPMRIPKVRYKAFLSCCQCGEG